MVLEIKLKITLHNCIKTPSNSVQFVLKMQHFEFEMKFVGFVFCCVLTKEALFD